MAWTDCYLMFLLVLTVTVSIVNICIFSTVYYLLNVSMHESQGKIF